MASGASAGVLLSGPNGVGKSAIGLLAFCSCMARGLFVAYIPAAQNWVNAAAKGWGDAFLLQTFWRQNADLIAATPALREVFKGALEDSKTPFTRR